MKKKNIEKKIYELLGVNLSKNFKQFAGKLSMQLFDINKPKEEITKEYCDYIMKRGHDLDNLKIHKKEIKTDAKFCIITFIISLISLFISSTMMAKIYFALLGLLELYIIMVLRYNYIRINEVLEKTDKNVKDIDEESTDDLQQVHSLDNKQSDKTMNNEMNDITNECAKTQADVTKEQLEEDRALLEEIKYLSENVALDEPTLTEQSLEPVKRKRSLKSNNRKK